MKYQICQENTESFLSYKEYKNVSYENILYEGSQEIWKELEVLDYIKIILCAVIMVGGSLGNLSVILTVVFNKSMRTNINFYIANLAVADFMVCSISVIPHAIKELTANKYYPLGEFMCKFNPFIQNICLISSVLTLSSISCDRSLAVLFPLRRRVTKQRPSVVLIVTWNIAVLLSIPIILFKEYRVKKWQNFTHYRCKTEWSPTVYDEALKELCIKNNPLHAAYTIILSITLFFLPVVIMITAYLLIMMKLRSTRAPGERNDTNINRQSTARKKVNKMVFIVLVVFIICWLPLEVLYLCSVRYTPEIHLSHQKHTKTLRWFLDCLAYANSFFNPMIYGWYNRTFRDGFSVLLRCGYKRENFTKRDTFDSAEGTKTNFENDLFILPLRPVRTAISSLGSISRSIFSRRITKSSMPQRNVKETYI